LSQQTIHSVSGRVTSASRVAIGAISSTRKDLRAILVVLAFMLGGKGTEQPFRTSSSFLRMVEIGS
jgi:hypothetical protein